MKHLFSEQKAQNTSQDVAQPRSLLKSGIFLVSTTFGLLGLVLSCWTLYLGLHHWPTLFGPLLMIPLGFAYSWWLTIESGEELQALRVGGSPEERVTAIERALKTLQSVVFYCFTAMLTSLACIAYLLQHCR